MLGVMTKSLTHHSALIQLIQTEYFGQIYL